MATIRPRVAVLHIHSLNHDQPIVQAILKQPLTTWRHLNHLFHEACKRTVIGSKKTAFAASGAVALVQGSKRPAAIPPSTT
jgi:hypothetical protein